MMDTPKPYFDDDMTPVRMEECTLDDLRCHVETEIYAVENDGMSDSESIAYSLNTIAKLLYVMLFRTESDDSHDGGRHA